MRALRVESSTRVLNTIVRVAPPPHRMPTTLRALFALALALALAWWWPSGAPPYLKGGGRPFPPLMMKRLNCELTAVGGYYSSVFKERFR